MISTFSYSRTSYAYRAFWAPEYKGNLLAWCLADGKQCGREPARRYCRAMGYEALDRFRPAEDFSQKTRSLDSRHFCTSGYCQSYQVIFCKNRFGPF